MFLDNIPSTDTSEASKRRNIMRRFPIKITMLLLFVGIISIPFISSMTTPSAQGLKIYISVDMEGIAGVVTGDQLGPSGFEYERFRRFATNEVNAAIHAAKEAGASEILVSDSHGNGENLLFDQFPPDVRTIRSWPRRLGQMAGIDETFDAAILIGYHASTTNLRGTRAHTFSSGKLTRVALNGTPVSESVWSAAIAGHFNVPIVMISGDDALYEEIKPVLGDIEYAETQKSLSFHSVNALNPEASCKLIAAKVTAALARLDEFKPYKLKTPVTLDVSFKNYRPVQVLAYLSIIKRIDSHTIRFVGKDMTEISDFRVFLTSYSFDLEP
jgi:D-amino peptidase